MNRLTVVENDVIRIISANETMNREDLSFPDEYWVAGRSALEAIGAGLDAAGKPVSEIRRILDIPCGHGRVMRYLKAAFPSAELTACDLLREGVDFCSSVFGAIPVYSHVDTDKIPLEHSVYDLIWVGSLFTHLDASQWKALLVRLTSSLREGGVLIFTAHGRYVYRSMKGLEDSDSHGLPYWRVTKALYRYERSGVVHGLTRVRGLTQDDAHIFCTREQLVDEVAAALDFVLEVLRDYGLDDFYLELSTRPEDKAVGTDTEWEEATAALRTVAETKDLDLVLDEGGGAFYGPKVSVQAKDAIGRTWQLSTIQVDLQMPQRFDLHYIGADNERHRPVMIHRALFGAVERFFAILVEHYAGAFPAWLAPVQVTVLPVADRHDAYAFRIADRLKAEGYRVEVHDAHSDTLGARVRRAKTEKVPYVLVVGDEDAESGTVGVNRRGSDAPERGVSVDDFVERLAAEVASKR
jgi:SAM-dependent methyltransferase